MEKQEKRFKKSILSIIIVLLATLIQYVFWPMIEPAPYLLFYPAIILSCIFANGILGIILSALVGQFLFIQPYYEILFIWPNDYVRLIFFILSSFLIRSVVEKQLRAKKESKQALDALLEERAERENFVSALTHDLQTPLTAIRLSTQLLEKKKEDKDALKKNCERILHNVNRIEQMAQDILDTNRIRAGASLPLIVKEMEITEYVQMILNDLNLIHHQRFILDFKEKIHGHWSPEAIRRILENLCSNAIKYGEDKTPVTIRIILQNPNVLIEVHNQGPAIPPHEQLLLFDLYKRSLSAKKSGKKGWGLGLTLVKGLSESMGGSVKVKSEEGFGTCFTVTLPLDVRNHVSLID